MNEVETRAEPIDPALREAGWGVVTDSRVRRETICPGRIEGAGRRGSAGRAKSARPREDRIVKWPERAPKRGRGRGK